MNVHAPLGRQEPIQRTGSYRSWAFADSGDARVIDLAWYSNVTHGSPEHHRLLPFTEPSVAIRRRYGVDGTTVDWDLVVFPARPDGGIYSPAPGEELYGLRLAPEWMESQLRMRATDYFAQDRDVPRAIATHLDRVRSLADGGAFRQAWSELALVILARTEEAQADRLAHAAAIVRKVDGRVSPAELARMADISPRHLRRGFAERFGLSPRGIGRRLRLTAAMLEADRSAKPEWARIAAGHRFADQAHMIRECRALLGESPGSLHSLRRSLSKI